MTNIFKLFEFIYKHESEYKPPFKILLKYAPEKMYLNNTSDEGIFLVHVSGFITQISRYSIHLEKIPTNITVNNYLRLSGFPSNAIPENLTVNGDLELSKCGVMNLPKSLVVTGGIYVSTYMINKYEQLYPHLHFYDDELSS